MSVGFNVAFYKKKKSEEEKKWSFFISATPHIPFADVHDECRERHDIVCAGKDEKWMIPLYSGIVKMQQKDFHESNPTRRSAKRIIHILINVKNSIPKFFLLALNYVNNKFYDVYLFASEKEKMHFLMLQKIVV